MFLSGRLKNEPNFAKTYLPGGEAPNGQGIAALQMLNTTDRKFSVTYDFPEYINGKRNLVSLDDMLPMFIKKAEEIKSIKERRHGKNSINRN